MHGNLVPLLLLVRCRASHCKVCSIAAAGALQGITLQSLYRYCHWCVARHHFAKLVPLLALVHCKTMLCISCYIAASLVRSSQAKHRL
eukprot:1162058-Pelagomonas_calceolata.AAC.1